jgi:hypothetical protein
MLLTEERERGGYRVAIVEHVFIVLNAQIHQLALARFRALEELVLADLKVKIVIVHHDIARLDSTARRVQFLCDQLVGLPCQNEEWVPRVCQASLGLTRRLRRHEY